MMPPSPDAPGQRDAGVPVDQALAADQAAPGRPPPPDDLGPPPDQAPAPPGGDIYAAPDGSGSACSLAAPCSLGGAQALARTRLPSAGGDVIVDLRGGTYRLAQTFVLDGRDAGSNGHQMIYRAYQDEQPVLSGAVRVSSFQKVDAARNLWRAAVPAGLQARQLFVDGVRAERPHSARDSLSFTPTAHGLATVDANQTPLGWTLRPGIEVAVDNAWKHMRCAVSAIQATSDTTPLPGYPAPASGGTTLVVEPGCWANNETAVIHPGYPFNGGGVPPSLDRVSTIENVYELLGQNGQTGQFYLDTAANFVYYVPRAGEDLTQADVEVPVLQALVSLNGTPGHLSPINDDDAAVAYTADWSAYGNRGFGDWRDDVHATTSPGGTATFRFTGTGVDVLGELDPDHGGFTATVTQTGSGAAVNSSSATEKSASDRFAQQVIYSIGGLAKGDYTVTLQKSGSDSGYFVIDGFVVTSDVIAPIHDIAFRNIGFAFAAWNDPSQSGYIDNQAGVLWDPVTHAPARIPGAVTVHRGQRIQFDGDTFAHLGGAGIDFADGTRGSRVSGSRFDDISGGAISVGEVDDYYLADNVASGTARMTSDIDISNNVVTNTGLDYHDTVAIWVGNSRTTTVAHNLVAHTSYTGISLGWGWGWVAPCSEQSAARPGEPCRRGTNYNGGNQILDNRVYDVMRTLVDGGPIYTLGEQAILGGVTPTVSGNVVSDATSCFHMIYHDEGSSYWQTYDNIVYNTGCHWLGIWIPTAHDIVAGGMAPNYSDNPQAASDDGTHDTIVAPTLLPLGVWPQAAQTIADAAGVQANYVASIPKTTLLNDGDAAFRYSSDASNPQWGALDFRGFGDYKDDVHYATADGAAMWLGFVGTGVDILGEKDNSQGMVEAFVDGASQGMFDTSLPAGAPRQTQQVIFGVHGLAAGAHTVSIVKRSGSYATIDGARFAQAVSETTASP